MNRPEQVTLEREEIQWLLRAEGGDVGSNGERLLMGTMLLEGDENLKFIVMVVQLGEYI